METNQYIGIDLHKAFFQVAAMTRTGERTWEGRYPRTSEGLEALADALRRESVVSIYYPPPMIRELRELCRHRLLRTQLRTRVLQRLRALLLRHGLGDPPVRTLRSVAGQTWLDGVSLPPRAHDVLQTLRRVERGISEQLAQVEADVRREAEADPVVARLRAIRGVGPVGGLTLRAEIADIARFPTAGHLASYAGLVCRVDASATRTRYGRITKDGSPWLRWALGEIGLHALRRPDPVGRWGRTLALRKGRMVAQVALARLACADVMERWRQG